MEDEKDFIPTTYENSDRITGPFYHGTASVLGVGDLLVPGFSSNYQKCCRFPKTAAFRQNARPPARSLRPGRAHRGLLLRPQLRLA